MGGCVRVCLRSTSNLQWREVMVDKESQSTNRDDQELYSERVMVPIISSLELQVDQVHSGVCTTDVDDLRDTDHTDQNMKG